MRKFYILISIFIVLGVIMVSTLSFDSSVHCRIFFRELDVPVGFLIALSSSFSFLASIALLIGLGLTNSLISQENVKVKNKIEDAKIKQEIEVDKVKQLEAKVKTLEEALKKVIKQD